MTKLKRPAFRSLDQFTEVDVGLPPARDVSMETEGQGIDLSKMTPIWFLIGPNNSGKTFFARYAAENASEVFLAALDTTNRTLARFFENVEQPESYEQDDIDDLQQRGIDWCAENRVPAIFDTGGGNTSLRRMIEADPGIARTMEAADIAPIAAYFLSPRQDDLGTLAYFEGKGFQPKATVLILNAKDGGSQDYDGVRQNRVFKAAVERGAMVVFMPRLYPDRLARLLEEKNLHFARAIDGAGGISITDRSRIRAFRDLMSQRFDPLRSWFPR